MTKIRPSLIALACLTSGCFGVHGSDDPDPDPDPDPPQWTDCYAALEGANGGDTCDFADMCGEFGCDAMDGLTVSCVAGTVRFIERICSPVMWFDCEEFRDSGWGTVGDLCDSSSFGTCGEPLVDCCGTSYRCDGGIVEADSFCADGCEELPFCEDYMPPPPEAELCTSASECPGAVPCVPAGSLAHCGVCIEPVYDCMVDRDCDSGEVCATSTPDCACGPSYVCQPRCTEGSCDEGFACNSAGVCQPVSCHDGFGCPSNTRCFDGGPGRPGFVDQHGCQRVSCVDDLECDCGTCIDGWCHSGPGVCQVLAP